MSILDQAKEIKIQNDGKTINIVYFSNMTKDDLNSLSQAGCTGNNQLAQQQPYQSTQPPVDPSVQPVVQPVEQPVVNQEGGFKKKRSKKSKKRNKSKAKKSRKSRKSRRKRTKL